ncbi:uncharacterized protein DI49_2193 [Saccharomyces eubayanus]|uniref:uncharacterized protein n=1 Tax=Saccharomyces eubayanus TaxID=1080349 RepID=UPI0006BF51FF|nr:hypothetical protein DI49_2193 [Saccharomyces eubayanus]KOG99711.1 hypothetical protein DI49_2193 [Saccharomyces eubayanus]
MAQLFAPFRVNCFPLWDIFFVYGFPYWSIIRSLHFYYVIAAKRHPSSPTVTCVGLADFFEIGLENPMEAKKKGKKKGKRKTRRLFFFSFFGGQFSLLEIKECFCTVAKKAEFPSWLHYRLSICAAYAISNPTQSLQSLLSSIQKYIRRHPSIIKSIKNKGTKLNPLISFFVFGYNYRNIENKQQETSFITKR